MSLPNISNMKSTPLAHGTLSPRRVLLTLAAALALTGLPSAALAAPEPDIRRDAVVDAVQKVMPAVVNVGTEEVVAGRDALEDMFRDFFDPYYRRRAPNTQFSVGSGVIIDEEGVVLTNFHVVNRARRVWVKLSDGREYECERLAGTSFTDIALLKIKAKPGEKFTSVKFAADDDLLLGETVIALGNPFGLGGSVSRGILSSKSRRPARDNEPLDFMDWLQTDASINPGNSGGGLINLRGELIGINVAIYREGRGIGFAIPIKRISAAMAEIYSPEWLEKLWFGARVRPGAIPLQVLSVQDESPADKAGLKPGDTILQVNGQSPKSFIDFTRQLTGSKEQKTVSLAIQRGNSRQTVNVRMVPEKTFFNSELIRRKIGLSLQELTPELAASLHFGRVEGLLIGGIDKPSPAEAAGLQHGMLITSIDDQNLNDILSAAKILHSKAKGDKVQLHLIYPRQIGMFIEYRQYTVEITVR